MCGVRQLPVEREFSSSSGYFAFLTSDFKRFQRLSPRFDFSSSFISVLIKNIVKDLRTAKLHLYADDTVT